MIDELGELDRLTCECGGCFVLLALGEVDLAYPAEIKVVRIRDDDLPLAA